MPLQLTLIQSDEVINGGRLAPTPLSRRFDANLIESKIYAAMLRFVRPVLGLELYNALVAEKQTTVSNYNPKLGPLQDAFTTASFEALWQLVVRDMCASAVVHVALPNIVTQIGSNGVYNINTEYGESTGKPGAMDLQDEELKTFNVLAKEFRRYMCTQTENPDFQGLYDFEKYCEECKAHEVKKQGGILFYKTRTNKNTYEYDNNTGRH